MQSYPYDNDNYEPAAPVVPIEIFVTQAASATQQVDALIDSGADATILPLPLLEAIRAPYADTHWWRTVSGERRSVSLFWVTIRVAGQTIHGVRAVGATFDTEPILGRDVLNQLVLTLDGLAEHTTITR